MDKKEPLISSENPFSQGLLKRLPEHLRESFTDEQLAALNIIFARQVWRNHPIDFRKSVGLLKWRYYIVFIAGRDLRQSRVSERPFTKAVKVVFLSCLIIFMILFGLLVIYLIKSALGINIFPHFSLGIWGWFKEAFVR